MVKIELTKPQCGWAKLIFKESEEILFEGLLSYVQDVPGMIIGAAIQYHKMGITDVLPSMYFDEEGSNYIIVPQEYWTYIITEKNDNKLLSINISARKLFSQLIYQIERNLKEWATFDAVGDETEDEIKELENKLRSLIDEYKKSRLIEELPF